MDIMASQITSLTIAFSTFYSGADQRKHQSSASLAFVRGIHWWPVNTPHKWPVTLNFFPFDDVILKIACESAVHIWERQILSSFVIIANYITSDKVFIHDDVIKWKHFPRYWPFVRGIHRSPVNLPHKGQWRGALVFSLICAWTNGWVNNREPGDLRRHRVHYDVTVMHNDIMFSLEELLKHVNFINYLTWVSPNDLYSLLRLSWNNTFVERPPGSVVALCGFQCTLQLLFSITMTS